MNTVKKFTQKTKTGFALALALSGTFSQSASSQNIETYYTDQSKTKIAVVLTKTLPTDQWNLHESTGEATYAGLRSINTQTGQTSEQIEYAASNEIVQSGILTLRYIGSGDTELPVFELDIRSLQTLESGRVYVLQLGTYYNGAHTIGRVSFQLSLFISKGADGIVSTHAIGIYNGDDKGRTYHAERYNNAPHFSDGSSNISNTAREHISISVPRGQAQQLETSLIPTTLLGKLQVVAQDGSSLLLESKSLTYDPTSKNYRQEFSVNPAYGVKIKSVHDDNKALDIRSSYGNNKDGYAHLPGFALIKDNPQVWHDSPQFGAVQATPRDATHYDVTVAVNNIKAGATGVTVQAINQSTGQTITGSYDATTKQAKFTNLAVSSSDLITAFDLKLSYGIVAGSHSPTTQTSLDNRTAPEIKTNPLMINFVNGKTDTTFYLRNNLNNPKVFNDNTLYTAKSSLPSGVTIASDGKVTISKTTAPQTTTVNSEVSRTLRDGSKVKSAQDQQLSFTISQDQSANTEHEHNNDGVISISSVDGVVSIAAGSTISFSDLPSNFNEGSYSILSDDFSAIQLSKGSYSASSGISTSGLQSAKSYIIYLVSADKKDARSVQVVVR